MLSNFKNYLQNDTKAAPLAVFRISFGVMMAASILRFWAKGWIETLYIQPQFHFTYFGFEWVKPLGQFTYLLFLICGVSALFVALGFKYRFAIITFFLSFTYIELMDKTTYLNHYYFISLVAFVLIFLPANACFSIDRSKKEFYQYIPRWSIDCIKLLLGIVYFYAGLAKLNSDWLLKAQPMKIWLSTQYDLPILGPLLSQEWMHYLLSWGGALYDLSIPFLLLYKGTRPFAFITVVVFHLLTRIFFPIGMFPYIMIVSALIFFDASVHEKIISAFAKLFQIKNLPQKKSGSYTYPSQFKKPILVFLGAFFTFQLIFPWRYLAYPGELFWTEEGYRFSWRVMLMEKTATADFKVVDQKTGKRFYVDNADFLTPFQEKEMAAQADFILEYAHFLENHFSEQGHKNLAIYVESYATLNGRRSQPYVDPDVNLLSKEESFQHKDWILPLNDEIKGL